MIYTLIEQLMEGNVTIRIKVLGIEADSFEEAVIKLKKLDSDKVLEYEQFYDDKLIYKVRGEKYHVYGTLTDKVLTIV